MERNNNNGLFGTIVIATLLIAGSVWFVIGKNRIVRGVPEETGDSERVILVTPQATPTSEVTPTPEEREQSSEKETKPSATPIPPKHTPTPAASKTTPTPTESKTAPTPTGTEG